MNKHVMHYETLLRLSRAITISRDPEEVALLTTESVTTALDVKGCALFLIDNKSHELKVKLLTVSIFFITHYSLLITLDWRRYVSYC